MRIEERGLRIEEVETSSQEMSDSQTVRFQTLVFGPILRASPSSFLKKEPALRACHYCHRCCIMECQMRL